MVLSNVIDSTKKTITCETRRANQQYAQKAIATASSYKSNVIALSTWSASFRFSLGCGVSNGVTSGYSRFGFFPTAPTWKPW